MSRIPTALAILAFGTTAVYGSTPRNQFLKNLPLRFEEARDATYTARGADFLVTLAPDQNRLEWTDARHHKTARVTTRLVHADPNAHLAPEDRLSGTANYFIGARNNWRTDVTGFGRIKSRDVYPGIDLVFHGENGRLEYDFIVAPGADPNAIALEVSGHQTVQIDTAGDLVIRTAAGDVRWKAPEIYQEAGGSRTRIDGRFVRTGKATVAFRVGAYDRSRALVIDPALSYSTFLGSTANEAARGIALDAAGNVYIAGSTTSIDLPTVSALQPNFSGLTASIVTGDGFVAKFSPAGALLYLTYLGGTRDDGISAIAVDAAGNAYVTGGTTSLDFPTVNPYQAHFGGVGPGGVFAGVHTGDAFVAKINPTGNKLIYSTYLGGSLDDVGLAIAIDSKGDAYVSGATASTNFPLSVNTTPAQGRMMGAAGEPVKACCNGPFWESGDAFLAELDPTGAQLLYSTYLGGSQDDAALAVAVDSSNNVYVAGCTISTDFPTTKGAFQTRFGGFEFKNLVFNFGDGFVTKFNSSGQKVYSTLVGGTGDECINGIAVDSSGDVFMAGFTTSSNLATPSAFQQSYAGYTTLPRGQGQLFGDAFVAELNPSGSALVYFTYLGGSANDAATAIAIDGSGNAVVTGWTDSPNFPLSGSPYQTKLAGDGGQYNSGDLFGDAFIAVVNPSGSALLYSTYLGGNADDGGLGIALDAQGKIYIAGNTLSTNFPATPGAFQSKFGGQKTNGNGVAAIRAGAFFGDVFYTVFSELSSTPPAITSVTNAFGDSPTISANTWVAVKGTGLSTTTRPWGNSDFVNAQLPTSLDGVSVTMNGTSAYVYYISAKQINVLTPPDLAAGPVQVQVSSSGLTSGVFTVQAQPYSLSFFVFNGGPYVIATHLDGSLVGPTTLFPGATTPAAPGETVIIYANGFGPVNPPVV